MWYAVIYYIRKEPEGQAVILAIYQKECYSVDKGIGQEEFLEMERETI